jgi:hypothetical protein
LTIQENAHGNLVSQKRKKIAKTGKEFRKVFCSGPFTPTTILQNFQNRVRPSFIHYRDAAKIKKRCGYVE